MLFAYTDFHVQGPYRGELEAAARRITDTPFVHLMHDAPAFDPAAAGQLLAALSQQFRAGDVCLAVIDPGVGGARRPAAVRVQGCWFVGPDNGLLSLPARMDPTAEWWEITWQPDSLSVSFHGRDLFAPFAARLAAGESPTAIGARPLHDPVILTPDPERVIYIDGYGNCLTGIDGRSLDEDAVLAIGDHSLEYAFTFDSVPRGNAFWYVNSMGLVEIAINQSSAARVLGLTPGAKIEIERR